MIGLFANTSQCKKNEYFVIYTYAIEIYHKRKQRQEVFLKKAIRLFSIRLLKELCVKNLIKRFIIIVIIFIITIITDMMAELWN